MEIDRRRSEKERIDKDDRESAVKFGSDDDSVPVKVKKAMTSTGARISAQVDGLGFKSGEEMEVEKSSESHWDKVTVNSRSRMSFEEFLVDSGSEVIASEVKEEPIGGQSGENEPSHEVGMNLNPRMSFEEFLKATDIKVMSIEECMRSEAKLAMEFKQCEGIKSRFGLNLPLKVKDEPDFGPMEAEQSGYPAKSGDEGLNVRVKQEEPIEAEPISWSKSIVPVKDEAIEAIPISCLKPIVSVKDELIEAIPISCVKHVVSVYEDGSRIRHEVGVVKGKLPCESSNAQFLNKFNRVPARQGHGSQNPTSDANKRWTNGHNEKTCSIPVEDDDFPEEPDWFLVGSTMVTAVSTTKGRKLADNEIVHFSFPSDWRWNAHWIVRFSTKRYGEIGRLPMDLGKCVVPLVNSRKVKLYGRCVAAPSCLHIMQDIVLYLSFYIHRSVFVEKDSSWGWKLEAVNIDSTINPLLNLFKFLKIKPYLKAEFSPEELDSRKRLLNLEAEPDEASAMLPIVKRRKGCQQYPEQNKDEHAVSESSLNKIVGAADVYNLEEMEPPSTLTCDLRSYQKQALYWMSELEKGTDVEKAANTLHPCWAAYRITDQSASTIYVNLFSGEATTKFPNAMQMARGGILADAMGLGKTVMTIALLLKNRGRGCPDNPGPVGNSAEGSEIGRDYHVNVSSKPKGGTLIVCPMALLGQWKDELETHSEPESISIFVHYGGERSSNPKVLADHDVVLTTYGVLAQAHKHDGDDSIFHKVDWYRVVLDEAHTIKSWKTQGARATFMLSSYCRWCLTGTPIQNNLEDLFSLLCFLHVEPWCNWAWWNKLIQKPYENGDPRGLRLVKAILRRLMLRRTKETRDKEGRPILVLPPTDIQIIECEQSEAEQDFYDALFKRSKVQFDQFVAQGKVLHNYANILELLLRLRQCCNHPFLVMSRADSQKFADLNKLARRFLEANSDSDPKAPNAPTKAYVEEVVDGIRRGENSECPICLESADDPVLTPCAHRMCRECLLSSWRSPQAGLCPICRQILRKADLITCPSESRFHVDVQKNWKESSKISSLLQCLEQIQVSGSGEKSIVFSQWTTFLDLLEIPLKSHRIGYLRYDGSLSQTNRDKVLYEFNHTNQKMVLLMSLRAGGVGLNLTAASNVFLVDPWWNPAVEEQAIMRIHRIGQKRTVSVRRFIVKDTVEERMQQVQARKQRMIAGALTDEEVRSARIEELKMLFR